MSAFSRTRSIWCFWTNEMRPCEELYELLAAELRRAFKGVPLDERHDYYY
jgi:hypothetical protein